MYKIWWYSPTADDIVSKETVNAIRMQQVVTHSSRKLLLTLIRARLKKKKMTILLLKQCYTSTVYTLQFKSKAKTSVRSNILNHVKIN